MLEEWQKEEICRERMTLLGLRLAAHMEKKNLPKKLASNDAEDLLCSLFLYFLSFFPSVCMCVLCAFLREKKIHQFFLTVVHPNNLCSWEDVVANVEVATLF